MINVMNKIKLDMRKKIVAVGCRLGRVKKRVKEYSMQREQCIRT